MSIKSLTPVDIQSTLFDRLSSSKFANVATALPGYERKDLKRRMDEALANPLDYPALGESIFPGDRIAVALQTGLSHVKDVLALLLEQILQTGVESKDVVIVINPELAPEFGFSREEIEAASNPNSVEAPQLYTKSIDQFEMAFQIHNSNNKTCVSYLAANDAGEPIYLNRLLVDADVIIPVGFPAVSGDEKSKDSLYPEFSSTEIKSRFASGESSLQAQSQEIQLANDTLGSFFAIQIINGPGGSVEKVISGARQSVIDAARPTANVLWEYQGPKNSALTIATIETKVGKTTWDDFVRAVIAASRISADSAPIIVWSDLDIKPSKQIRQALVAQFDDGFDKKLPQEMKQLIAIIQEHPIYLHSKLSSNEVESLGIGYVDSATAVNRIAESCERGIVLRDAHQYRMNTDATVKPK